MAETEQNDLNVWNRVFGSRIYATDHERIF